MSVVTIERLVPGGQGLAKDEKGVVFVDRAAIGDVVDVKIVGKQGGARRGSIAHIVTPSVDRVPLDCAVADRCGGCDWLHLSSSAQQRGKLAIANDALRRVGRFSDDDVAAALRPLVSLSAVGAVSDRVQSGRRRCRVVIGRDGAPTYSAAHSHERVSLSSCVALHPRLEQAVLGLKGARLAAGVEVRLAVSDGDIVVAAVTDVRAARALVDSGVVVGALVTAADDGRDVDSVGDVLMRGEVTAGLCPDAQSDAATFTQATRSGGAAIRDAVMAGVSDVVDGAVVLELFCGAGHLTLPLAMKATSVFAYDGDARALRHLDVNRALVKGNVSVRRAYIDADLAVPAADVVIADPPRTGLVDAKPLLLRLTAKRLVLVSCDPATGARDLRAAVDAGFTLRTVTPIDAFPRTHHLEWVAVLDR